ncbi:MAG: methionyl-tRNA formyltransferase [bacterium]|nr:MAG: methionyl-tRNA formyltransferase [bacterium]
MRIVFMGSPALAIPSLEASRESGQLVGVISQPPRRKGRGLKVEPSPVSAWAEGEGIPVHTPESIRTPEFMGLLRSMDPDVVVVVAFGKILPPSILAAPPMGCVNVHASLLPELRGAAPIQWAIARGYETTGVTLMQMDEGMDTGPILLQSETSIRQDETSPELGLRLAQAGGDILLEGLPAMARGELHPVDQDHSLATYAPLIKKEDGLIDWSLSADEIANRMRAFVPWPGTYTHRRGKRIGIVAARVLGEGTGQEPGRVVAVEKDGIEIACGRGVLRVERLKPEGKVEMTASDYASGYRIAVGDRLGK